MFQANLTVVSKYGVEIILQPGQAIVNINSEDGLCMKLLIMHATALCIDSHKV